MTRCVSHEHWKLEFWQSCAVREGSGRARVGEASANVCRRGTRARNDMARTSAAVPALFAGDATKNRRKLPGSRI